MFRPSVGAIPFPNLIEIVESGAGVDDRQCGWLCVEAASF
jgi:hypothetical protein